MNVVDGLVGELLPGVPETKSGTCKVFAMTGPEILKTSKFQDPALVKC